MAFVSRSVTGLYRRPCWDSEMVTQETLGHRVAVRSFRKGFARCRLRDGYVGWLPAGALSRVKAYAATHLVTSRFARMSIRGGGPLMLPMGSLLKVATVGKVRHTVELPDGRVGSVGAGSVRAVAEWNSGPAELPSILRRLLGIPYLWGGKSTFGFDCSGLVQFAFGLVGIRLPRDSKDQAGKGRLVEDLGRLRPLDLVFFGTAPGIDHVAIHLGELKIAHASGYVRIESLDRASARCRPDLLKSFRFARRVAHV